jgi:hypothetical protein
LITQTGGTFTGTDLTLGGTVDPISGNEGVGIFELAAGGSATITEMTPGPAVLARRVVLRPIAARNGRRRSRRKLRVLIYTG